jgi:hypothetical protein
MASMQDLQGQLQQQGGKAPGKAKASRRHRVRSAAGGGAPKGSGAGKVAGGKQRGHRNESGQGLATPV